MAAAHLQYPILLSILAALLTLGLKFTAYSLTGSVGLLSDAAESLVNLLAAVTAFLSLLYAARPVDESHTYGHEKIEFFSSGLEGTLILVAALGIAWYAVQRLFAPAPLESVDVGLLISLAASAINLGVGQQTPPVASVLITTCSIAGVPMSDVMRVNVYFIAALFVVLLLVTFLPGLSLFLPELLAPAS